MTQTLPETAAPHAPLPAGKAALVVAHPGHELRVHHWMELARPLVFVLTDGSGGSGEARIESTGRLLEVTEARQGAIYGRVSDREIYAAMLAHDHAFFLGLADELAAALAAEEIDYVVADAEEGYNPSHDVCRLVVDAAVRMAARRRPGGIAAYDFLLVGAPDECREELRPRAVRLQLDPGALERKLRAARAYPELAGEVERALERFGAAPFSVELLRPVEGGRLPAYDEAPFYETYGERQVAAGVYERVLRFHEHVLPLAEALRSHAERA